jgi:hypothetical protein
MGSYEGDDHGIVDAAVAKEHAAAAGLRVDRENVLYVRRAILEEYTTLKASLDQATRDDVGFVHKYGDDPVSRDAAIAFPERASRLIDQCQEHANVLLAMANKLELAARSYKYTDDDVVAMTPLAQKASVAELNATLHAVRNPWGRA